MQPEHPFDPDWVVAPGEMLRDWIDEQGITVRMCALACGRMSVPKMERILAGHEKITTEVAEALAHGTGIPRSFWVKLEGGYRAGLAAGKKVFG